MHQNKYLANRKNLFLAALLLVSGVSVLGIVVGYNFGYSVTILTVILVLVSIGAISGAVISGKLLVGFILGSLLTALLVSSLINICRCRRLLTFSLRRLSLGAEINNLYTTMCTP